MKPRMLNSKPAFTGRGVRHANDGTPDKPEAIIAALAAELKQRLGGHLRGLWLFGSRARGDARMHSDYDLLILVFASPDLRSPCRYLKRRPAEPRPVTMPPRAVVNLPCPS